MLVFDDVLDDPRGYRDAVLAGSFEDFTFGPSVFRGIQLARRDPFTRWIAETFPGLTPMVSFYRQSPVGQSEPNFVHTDRDMGDWTAILYLNPRPAAGDGTTFWRHRGTGAIESDATDATAIVEERRAWRELAHWEPVGHIGGKFGRALLFPAGRFHSRAIPENYGTGADARLVQVVFGTGAI